MPLKIRAVKLGRFGQIGMIGQDFRDLNGQVTVALSREEIGHTVVGSRAQNQSSRGLANGCDRMFHPVALDDRLEQRLKGTRVGRCFDLKTHEKPARVVAGKLLRLGDVPVGLDDSTRDGVDDTGLVIAHERDDEMVERGRHALSLG